MPHRATWICVPCRYVAKATLGGTCPHCRQDLRYMGKRWRPPRKSDDSAWRDIECGQTMWDRHAVQRAIRRWRNRFHPYRRLPDMR
jgi:hypothetical protein